MIFIQMVWQMVHLTLLSYKLYDSWHFKVEEDMKKKTEMEESFMSKPLAIRLLYSNVLNGMWILNDGPYGNTRQY